MDTYLRLIYEVPAAVSTSAIIVNIMPFSFDKRLNPLIMFACLFAVMYLPLPVSLALAGSIPMGLMYQYLGIRLQGHDTFTVPFDVIRAKVATSVQKLPTLKKEPEPEPVLKTAFPKYVPDLELPDPVDATQVLAA